MNYRFLFGMNIYPGIVTFYVCTRRTAEKLDEMSLVVKKNKSSGCPTRSDTNKAIQPQKMARGLKFRI